MRYVPALDGLRAVAILGVLVFHALPRALPGGFAGVDVFFVLSGYLIASVILFDLRAGSFTMREFYLRRVQRLLPNAVVMVFCTVAAATVVLLPSSVAQVGEHGLWTLLNLSNIYILRHFGDYWQDVASSAPLLHTWSLAVEEQFYLLLPVTLWLLSRRRGRTTFGIVASLAGAGYLLALFGTAADPNATFYLLPTRAWEPLLGAALALFRVPARSDEPLRGASPATPSWATELLGWTGLALILAAYLFISGEQDFPGWIALLPTGGAFAVLVAVADGRTGAARLLARPFPVQVGKLSYSIYLWHWPAIVLARTWCELEGLPPQRGTLAGAGLGVVLAALAYVFIERPLQQRGPGRRRRLLVLATGFVLCGLASFAVARHRPAVAAGVWFDPVHSAARLYDSARLGTPPKGVPTKYSDVVLAPVERSASAAWWKGGIVHPWGPGTPRVVVLGSSHALMYGSLLDDICRELALPVAFLSAHATAVDFDLSQGSAKFDAARRRFLHEWQPDLVIVIDRWDREREVGTATAFARQLRALLDAIEPETRRVLLFSQVPVLRLGEEINLREFVVWRRNRSGNFPAIAPDAKEPFRRETIAALEAVAATDPKVRILRADRPFFLPDGTVRYASGRDFYYLDDDHLSSAGAEVLRAEVTQAIREAFDTSGDGRLW